MHIAYLLDFIQSKFIQNYNFGRVLNNPSKLYGLPKKTVRFYWINCVGSPIKLID